MWLAVRSGVDALAVSIMQAKKFMLRRGAVMPWRCHLCNREGDGNAADFHKHYMTDHYQGRRPYVEGPAGDDHAGEEPRRTQV